MISQILPQILYLTFTIYGIIDEAEKQGCTTYHKIVLWIANIALTLLLAWGHFFDGLIKIICTAWL